MFRLKENIHVNAPVDRCFLLSTSIALVEQTIDLHPVTGPAPIRTTGLIQLNDQVLWRGWKFGIPAMHESLITRYERPAFFQDTQRRGYFASFQHDHQFEEVDGYTLMVDVVRFSLPLGPVGKVIAKNILIPHILKLLLARFTLLKRIAEGPDWERYLVNENRSSKQVAAALTGVAQP